MAASPRAASAYEKLQAGLDHVLALCLSGDDTVPASLRLSAQRATSPFEAWRNVRAVAAERYEHAITKAARRDAKRKLREKKEAEQAAADAEDDAPLRIVVKPTKIKKEEVKKMKPEKAKPHGPEVKMLDLSGANLSPVLTHAKAPPRVNDSGLASLDKLMTVTTKSSARVPVAESPRTDQLTRLRRLPLLEDVDPTSSKYRTIAKWLESDDGKDKPMSTSLSSLINKLQKNGVAASSIKSSSKRQVHLGAESLDDRLKKERSLERKKKQSTKKTNGVKPEPKRRKAIGTETSRKRKLGGFVVEPDEVEYETGGWEQDSEAEYESEGEASSSDEEEVDFEGKAETPKQDDVKRESRAVRNGVSGASPRKSTPPTSSKASPRSAQPPVDSDQSSMTGKEQLATVVTRLRELDKMDGGASTPTYLSYDHTSNAKGSTVASIKQELRVAATGAGKTKPYKNDDGTSESNAIVLDDSDEEEDDASDGDFQLRIALPAAPASPAPRRKLQRAPSPKQSKPPVNPPPKATGKAKAKAPLQSTSTKRKNTVSSDEDDSDDEGTGEAEFLAPGEDEDSSTDADDDMFDLNEDDVYVVESILEVKKGRTLMTNAGRYTKDPDLFLVKWEGYDELTWEPEVNIPKRIINLFNDRELAKQACGYQIDKFLQRKVAKNSTTGKDEILYLIQWKGLPQAYWEVKAMLPSKILVWLEKTSRASLAKAPLTGPSPRKKTKT